MNLWHLTTDARRIPEHACPGEAVEVWVGTWPIESEQAVWIEYDILREGEAPGSGRVDASWHHNEGPNSYWVARLPGSPDGAQVRYTVHCRSGGAEADGMTSAYRVGPRIHLAILWHHHQPLYLDYTGDREHYRFPWVRLHAIRDYYSMAALLSQYPKVHVTINLVPSLLMQVEGYVERGATDRALELTRKPAKHLTESEREELLGSFFDADWHNQIYVHPRYKELFEQRKAGSRFSTQDLTDLQMWFNLAWFAPELLAGEVKLPDGSLINIEPLAKRGRGFTRADVEQMLEAQIAILRNVVPIHRALQDSGQIEVSTTPFHHPILPLIHDTDLATLDRPGTVLPQRFQAPEDAASQVRRAADYYERRFGRRPLGMWPAEGAIGQSVLKHFIHGGVRWLASDEGVLQRSGRWGYRTDISSVLCQPYRAVDDDGFVTIFFRDRVLSDAIGFRYQAYEDQRQAAADFIADVKLRLANEASDPANQIVTVILDGENAWGAYRQAARPFLNALYEILSTDSEIKTVTFGEFLQGNPGRAVPGHAPETQAQVHDLFHGSWIDELGSAPGVDLGTWIGEEEENVAWGMLRKTREAISSLGATPNTHPAAFEAFYAAEGSDWFWWFGSDQESGYDDIFDDLFRGHLRAVYRALGQKPPAFLDRHIVPHTVAWTFARPVARVSPGDRLTIRTNCAGIIRWSIDGWKTAPEAPLSKAGGAMSGLHSYSVTLGPFAAGTGEVDFVFRCTECRCPEGASCCGAKPQRVLIADDRHG